jgi:hypothetical protein
MEESSKRAIERGLAWCGPLFVVAIIYTWGIMGHNIPPPNMMAMTPDQLISEYYGKYPEIGVGMILSATVGLFYTVWSCLLASLMRDEHGNVGALSFIELAGGILTGWLFAFCSAMWAACSILTGQVGNIGPLHRAQQETDDVPCLGRLGLGSNRRRLCAISVHAVCDRRTIHGCRAVEFLDHLHRMDFRILRRLQLLCAEACLQIDRRPGGRGWKTGYGIRLNLNQR